MSDGACKFMAGFENASAWTTGPARGRRVPVPAFKEVPEFVEPA